MDGLKQRIKIEYLNQEKRHKKKNQIEILELSN